MRKKIASNKATEIAEFTTEIYEDFAKDGKIDLFAVAKSEEITFSFGNYEDFFDGVLDASGKKFHIYCNVDRGNSADSLRGRFTFSHELGHYFIDEHRRALLRGGLIHHSRGSDIASTRVEAEADFFAASLLMPEKHVKAFLRKKTQDIAIFREISDKFQVSYISAAVRYIDLDISPCAIVMWNPSGTNWFAISDSLIKQGFNSAIHGNDKLYRGCATLAVQGTDAMTTAHESTTATSWFTSFSDFKQRERLFKEEAVSLGKYGMLTLLTPLR